MNSFSICVSESPGLTRPSRSPLRTSSPGALHQVLAVLKAVDLPGEFLAGSRIIGEDRGVLHGGIRTCPQPCCFFIQLVATAELLSGPLAIAAVGAFRIMANQNWLTQRDSARRYIADLDQAVAFALRLVPQARRRASLSFRLVSYSSLDSITFVYLLSCFSFLEVKR